MKFAVYNLEFPSFLNRLSIDVFSFDRVPNYLDEVSKLQSFVTSHGPEHSTIIRTGEHAQTATVTAPDECPPSVIPWPHRGATSLDDVLLLLQLFTQREVFVTAIPPNPDGKPFAFRQDPRQFPWGGVLACSIPFETKATPGEPDKEIETGLETNLETIYTRIKTQEWIRQFKGGYFLVLLVHAIRQWSLESAFSQCWTIWEHLFACLNEAWMSKHTLQHLNSSEKIAFLLVHFETRLYLQEPEKKRIEQLAHIRNRLFHFGQFPEHDSVRNDAIMFIRLTEYICTRALGLHPSNVFNTVERLEEFLTSHSCRQPHFG